MLLTDIVSSLALLGFCICWFRVGMARRDALLWASASVALLASIAGYANYRGTAMIALVVALVLLLALVIRRLRGSRVLSGRPWASSAVLAVDGDCGVRILDFSQLRDARPPAHALVCAISSSPTPLARGDGCRRGRAAALAGARLVSRGLCGGAGTTALFHRRRRATSQVFTHFGTSTPSYENAPLLSEALARRFLQS